MDKNLADLYERLEKADIRPLAVRTVTDSDMAIILRDLARRVAMLELHTGWGGPEDGV